jgi:hypothetical protein
MDAEKKAALEKKIVAGLAGVFVLSLARGPLMSLAGQAMTITPPPEPKPVAVVEKVTMGRSVSELMRGGWEKMEEAAGQAADPATPHASLALYSAYDSRDPFISLLPKQQDPWHQVAIDPLIEGLPQPQDNITTVHNQPAVSGPRPNLQIRGIVWGAYEPRAIIDNEVYQVNDSVAGVKIVSIGRDGITVDHAGRLFLYSPSSPGGSPVTSDAEQPGAP